MRIASETGRPNNLRHSQWHRKILARWSQSVSFKLGSLKVIPLGGHLPMELPQALCLQPSAGAPRGVGPCSSPPLLDVFVCLFANPPPIKVAFCLPAVFQP